MEKRGFEPPTYRVQNDHSNQLSYNPITVGENVCMKKYQVKFQVSPEGIEKKKL
jgi:hypothetical protein